MGIFFFFKQKTAYELRISDWSSDVCSSALFGLMAPIGVLDVGPGDRDSVGCAAGPVHAIHRLEIVGRAGRGGAFAADSLERRGYYLADIRTHRYWPYGAGSVHAGHRLQLRQ